MCISIILYVMCNLCTYLLGDKKPAKEHAAVWVPDSEAHYCMHCLKAKFTTMNRRVKYNHIKYNCI